MSVPRSGYPGPRRPLINPALTRAYRRAVPCLEQELGDRVALGIANENAPRSRWARQLVVLARGYGRSKT